MASGDSGTIRPTKRKRVFFAAAVLLIVCVLAVGSVSAVSYVSDYNKLADAISSASAEETIYIEDNITVPGDRSLSISTNITLSPFIKNVSISRGVAATTNQNGMFTIQEGGSLTIQGSDWGTSSYTLTLDGKKDDYPNNGQTLVWINKGGSFTLKKGGILTNNSVTGTGGDGNSKSGGAVYVNAGTFTMEGGEISNNTASLWGGGVYVGPSSTFEMILGDISDNKAPNGGGVGISSSTFTMRGGRISGNEAIDKGGGVYINSYSTFTLKWGNIADNSPGYSVYVDGTFNVQNTGTADSVYLPLGKVIAISNSFSGTISGIMPANKDIDTVIVDLSTFGSAQSLNYFSLDDTLEDRSLKYNEADNNLVLTTYHTVTFEAHAGTPAPGIQSVEHNTCAEKPDDPAKDGNKFDGWHTDEACTQPWDFDTPVTSDVTLYAKWTPNKPGSTPVPPSGSGSSDGNMDNAYRVLFNDGATTLYVVTDLSAGDKLTKPEDPVKDGYTFAGWHKDTACTQPWDFNDGITGDMTLYAKWTPKETVTPTATATPTVTATATATQTAEPTGDASPAPTSQPDDDGNSNTNGETTTTPGISLPYLISGILILLLAILLLLILLLRHTVTFLIPTGGELEEYRIKVWHGRYINTEDLPALIRTAAWYRDTERQERWDFDQDRVKKSIELYLG